MNSQSLRHSTLPPGLAARLDAACDRFESELLAGGRPLIEDFLPQVQEADRPALVRELVGLELEYRRCGGERPTAEEYRARFPQYENALAPLLQVLALRQDT